MNGIIRGMNNHRQTEERTGDSGMRKNLDLGAEKPQYSGKSLDE
jgi:hypothetical protein